MIDVRKVTSDMVIALASDAASKFGIRLSDIYSKSRDWPAIKARRHCYRVLASAGWSHAAIGKVFDRDRSTVTYALERDVRTTRGADCKPLKMCTPDDVFAARIGMARYQSVETTPSRHTLSWAYDQ